MQKVMIWFLVAITSAFEHSSDKKPETMDGIVLGYWELGIFCVNHTRRKFKAHKVASPVLIMLPCSKNRTGMVSSINHHKKLEYSERFCPSNFF